MKKKNLKIHKKNLHCRKTLIRSFNLSNTFVYSRGEGKYEGDPEITAADRFASSKRRSYIISFAVKIMKCTATKWADACDCVRNAARLRLYNARPGKVRHHWIVDRQRGTRFRLSTWNSAYPFFSSPSWPFFCTLPVRRKIRVNVESIRLIIFGTVFFLKFKK